MAASYARKSDTVKAKLRDSSNSACVLNSCVQPSLQNRGTFLSRTGHWSVRDNNFRVFTDRGESKNATKTSAGAADAQRKEHKTQTKGTTAHGQHMPQRFLRAQRLVPAVIIFGVFVTSISRSRDKKNQIRPTATLGKLRIRGQRLTI